MKGGIEAEVLGGTFVPLAQGGVSGPLGAESPVPPELPGN